MSTRQQRRAQIRAQAKHDRGPDGPTWFVRPKFVGNVVRYATTGRFLSPLILPRRIVDND